MKQVWNKNSTKMLAGALLIAAVVMVTGDITQAADFSSVSAPIVKLLNSFLRPLLALVVAGGTLYCVLLGVKFAKAEEPQDREKAKQHLKNAIIGFVLIFVLIVALNLAQKPLENWVTQNGVQIDNTTTGN